MIRFFKSLLKHPRSWVFLSLAMIGIGILAPIAAPALVLAAAVFMTIGVFTSIWVTLTKTRNFIAPDLQPGQKSLLDFAKENPVNACKLLIDFYLKFPNAHPIQAFVLGITLIFFGTALVLTIGFFTGGVGFAFMAPIFQMISAPFAIAAASAHVSLFLPALAGFCFLMAPLTVGNNLKRFLGWLDTFKYDAILFRTEIYKTQKNAYDNEQTLALDDPMNSQNEKPFESYKDDRDGLLNYMYDNFFFFGDNKLSKDIYFKNYVNLVFFGIFATVVNKGSSPYQDFREGKPLSVSVLET